MFSRFISFLFYRFVSVSSDPIDTNYLLIRVFDSSQPNLAGLYHYAPTVDHLAHAIACSTTETPPPDTTVLQVLARLSGSSILHSVQPPILLKMNPTYREAQRVLSQAQAAPAAPPAAASVTDIRSAFKGGSNGSH